jgi:hypothetical protein
MKIWSKEGKHKDSDFQKVKEDNYTNRELVLSIVSRGGIYYRGDLSTNGLKTLMRNKEYLSTNNNNNHR